MRGQDDPAFLQAGLALEIRAVFPLTRATRQLAMFDPKTGKYSLIDTCFATQHLHFGFDEDDTLWTSAGGGAAVLGWLDTKKFEETGDAAKSPGLDAADRRRRRRRQARRLCRAEPAGRPDQGQAVDRPASTRSCRARRRLDLGPTVGVGFSASAARLLRSSVPRQRSGEDLARRDLQCRRRASVRAAATSTAKGLRLGVALLGPSRRVRPQQMQWPLTGPNAATATSAWKAGRSTNSRAAVRGMATNSAEPSYYIWVDRTTRWAWDRRADLDRNENEALTALVDGKWSSLRVPYPMGFYHEGLDGRIDDPNAGWKGRGLWTTIGHPRRLPTRRRQGRHAGSTTSRSARNPLAD